jgi:hypothetical protein
MVASATHNATSKATPVDADEIPLADSAGAFALVKLTWANLKATLASWIAGGTIAGSFTTLASSQDITNTRAVNVNSRLTLSGSGAYNSIVTLNAAGGGAGQVVSAGASLIINAPTGQNVLLAINFANVGVVSATGIAITGTLSTTGQITVPGGAALLTTSAALNNGAAAAAGTLTNAPVAGNPTKWIPINDNGTTRYIPAW